MSAILHWGITNRLAYAHMTDSFTTRNGNGRTKDLRIHLQKKHSAHYNAAVKSKELKTLDTPNHSSAGPPEAKKGRITTIREHSIDRFTRGEFQCLLEQWFAADPGVNTCLLFSIRIYSTPSRHPTLWTVYNLGRCYCMQVKID